VNGECDSELCQLSVFWVETDATSRVKTHMKVPKDKSALKILAGEG
jgi:hypothetical protein